MLILELLRAEIAERGVQSAGVVDLIDEAWKVGGDVLEGLIGHRKDGLDLVRLAGSRSIVGKRAGKQNVRSRPVGPGHGVHQRQRATAVLTNMRIPVRLE